MAYVTDGFIGVDLTKTTAGTTTDGADAQFSLGKRVTATDGSNWIYVQAGASLTQYSALAVDENYQAVALTSTLAKAGHQVAFNQATFADNEFGWVATHAPGNITIRLAGSCAKDVQLYTGAAGVLDDTSTGVLIRGVVSITTNPTTAAGSYEGIAVYPSATATA